MVRSNLGASGWLERCVMGKVPCLKPFQGDPDKSEWGERGLRGLINMGNTCFMSCILQVLAHNPAIQAYFLHGGHDFRGCRSSLAPFATNVCLACELTSFFAALFKHRNKPHQENCSLDPVAPYRMLYAIWKTTNSMASYVQQDAHEFLMVLLDGLAHNIRKLLPTSSGFVHEVFRGSLRSDVARARALTKFSLTQIRFETRSVLLVVQEARVENPFLT